CLPVGGSPLRSSPATYSLVSARKVRIGCKLFLPLFFGLYPLRAPIWSPNSVCTVVSVSTTTALNLTLAASHTRCRMHRCTSNSWPATLPCSEARNRQKVHCGGGAHHPKIPARLWSGGRSGMGCRR